MLTHLCFSTASPFPFWFYHYYFFFLYPYGAVGFYLILFVRSAVGSNLFFFLSFPSYTGICCTFLAFTSEYKACWISFFFASCCILSDRRVLTFCLLIIYLWVWCRYFSVHLAAFTFVHLFFSSSFFSASFFFFFFCYVVCVCLELSIFTAVRSHRPVPVLE